MIDFSVAKAAMPAIRIAAKRKVNIVSGTTGFSPAEVEEMKKLAESNGIGIIWASNFAIGAIVMMHLSSIAAKYFDYAEIIELHHNLKWTRLRHGLSTAKAMAAGKGKPFNRPSIEKGETLPSRGLQTDGISIHSVRLPGFLAHQEVIFGAAGQTLNYPPRHHRPGLLYARCSPGNQSRSQTARFNHRAGANPRSGRIKK